MLLADDDRIQSAGDYGCRNKEEKGILIDVESGEIVAQKGAHDKISPASMTKILTVLVAAEHITPEQLDDTFTMTIEITDSSCGYQ